MFWGEIQSEIMMESWRERDNGQTTKYGIIVTHFIRCNVCDRHTLVMVCLHLFCVLVCPLPNSQIFFTDSHLIQIIIGRMRWTTAEDSPKCMVWRTGAVGENETTDAVQYWECGGLSMYLRKIKLSKWSAESYVILLFSSVLDAKCRVNEVIWFACKHFNIFSFQCLWHNQLKYMYIFCCWCRCCGDGLEKYDNIKRRSKILCAQKKTSIQAAVPAPKSYDKDERHFAVQHANRINDQWSPITVWLLVICKDMWVWHFIISKMWAKNNRRNNTDTDRRVHTHTPRYLWINKMLNMKSIYTFKQTEWKTHSKVTIAVAVAVTRRLPSLLLKASPPSPSTPSLPRKHISQAILM